MIITKSLLVGAVIAAIAGCGGSDALNGESLGPGGAGGGAALGRGTGGAAGVAAMGGAGAGAGAGGSAGPSAAGGSNAGRSGTAGAAGTGSVGSAAGGSRGGTAGSAAAGAGGAAGIGGGGGTPGTVACDQKIVELATARRGGAPVTCASNADGVCECTQVGNSTPDLHCTYIASDRTDAVGGIAPYCSNIDMTLDPCSGVIAAAAASLDHTAVTCVYGTSGCDCGPVGKAPDLICTADPTDPRDAFCSAYHPPF